VDVSYNLGGKVDAYIGIGFGYGEANYTAAGTFTPTSPNESPEMSDSEEQQNIRTELGLGDDHTNMLSL
jgi:opacity protein-like surface antigen